MIIDIFENLCDNTDAEASFRRACFGEGYYLSPDYVPREDCKDSPRPCFWCHTTGGGTVWPGHYEKCSKCNGNGELTLKWYGDAYRYWVKNSRVVMYGVCFFCGKPILKAEITEEVISCT